ncbi:hypothetical protein [uncultured Polaribacter sp.]|uniref:hypothetical protein n=1 Tax=uncultured Polaribacter sp. TaxID=174711 RepID=UPI002610A2E5|nr:hypothetical protein [uncultured Polaribacter sp.]
MKTEKFINLIENKIDTQQIETVELKSIIDQFPYFQPARALYLKGLKNQNSFKYNNELKITAAYTTDRTVLFDYITSKGFEEKQKETQQPILQEIIPKQNIDDVFIDIKNTTPQETSIDYKEIKEELSIGKPISFTSSENYSFNQWLQLSVKKPIEREGKSTKKVLKKEEIIDTFISNNPKITPLTKDKPIAVSVLKNKQDSSLMTETLAKVYLEQKKYENAIQAYRILSLKYPEKSGFFADQIKRIQILQKNKL